MNKREQAKLKKLVIKAFKLNEKLFRPADMEVFMRHANLGNASGLDEEEFIEYWTLGKKYHGLIK